MTEGRFSVLAVKASTPETRSVADAEQRIHDWFNRGGEQKLLDALARAETRSRDFEAAAKISPEMLDKPMTV